ncbi:MAG: type II CAAX prenyl endopeptidase Rce1 family protein [Flammeovirgaceae bacterium]
MIQLTFNPFDLPQTTNASLFELTAIVLTGLCKFIFVDVLALKFWFIISACFFWLIYVSYKIKQDQQILTVWGFTKKGFRSSLIFILPFALLAIISFAGYGMYTEKIILNWHIIPILFLYPLWGTIQQFLVISLMVTNLKRIEKPIFSQPMIILISSIVFASVHYPSLPLVIGTFLLAILYTITFLKYNNIWVLGLFHGWLGCFFYFFTLERDPWLEFIQAVQ